MAARTSKTTAATTPAKAAAPADNGTGFDFAALASGAKNVASLPTVTRTREGRSNALAELVTTSFTDGQAKQLPAVPGGEQALKSLTTALRRAASLAGLGVSVRGEIAEDGMVTVTFQGKPKSTR